MGSIGRTTTQAMPHNTGGQDLNETVNNDGWNLPGPTPPPPMPGMPSVRPLPPPPGLVLNIPRPPTSTPYSMPNSTGLIAPPPPRPPVINIIPPVRPPPPPISMVPGQPLMANQPSLLPSMAVTSFNVPVPLPPGAQFTPLGGPRPFVHIPMPHPGMPMVPPPPMLQGMPPPPPPEEAPPPLPDEPEPKRQRLDDSMLVHEDQFLVKHSGPAHISIFVPNVDEVNLKGQVLEITVQSLSETVGSLKEKIAGDIQLPANKQKLSGIAGFLKDNLSLAYYSIGPGDSLSLSLRERGGRKR